MKQAITVSGYFFKKDAFSYGGLSFHVHHIFLASQKAHAINVLLQDSNSLEI